MIIDFPCSEGGESWTDGEMRSAGNPDTVIECRSLGGLLQETSLTVDELDDLCMGYWRRQIVDLVRRTLLETEVAYVAGCYDFESL